MRGAGEGWRVESGGVEGEMEGWKRVSEVATITQTQAMNAIPNL